MRFFNCIRITWAATFLILSPVSPPLAESLFQDELTAKERQTLESSMEASVQAIEALQQLYLLMTYGSFERGDCTEFGNVERQATRGDAGNQYLLAEAYYNGVCIDKDPKKARKWLIRAAEQGFAMAQSTLAGRYYQEQDFRNSAKWMLQAAESGDADAQAAIGDMYQSGQGVPKSYANAIGWYERAAQQGHEKATFNLGLMYYEGQGVQPNPQKAFEWFVSAAKRGSGMNQYAAGLVQTEQAKTEDDLVEAYKWLSLATQSSTPQVADNASQELAKLEPAMSRDAVARAQNLTTEFEVQGEEFAPEMPADDLDWANLELRAMEIGPADDASEAKAKLDALQVPITRDSYFSSVENDAIAIYELFHRAGADLETDRPSAPGMTALYVAIDFGSEQIFDYLMEKGANVNSRSSKSGMTPLVRAISWERWGWVERLLDAGADASQPPETKPESQMTILSGTALNYALGFERPDLVSRLLKQGASVDERYTYFKTPLMMAVSEGYLPNVVLLLDAKADVNAKDEFGRTALHECLSPGENSAVNMEALILLLESGANPRVADMSKQTPLFLAAGLGDSDAISVLASFGADPNERYFMQKSEIPFAVSEKPIFSALQSGATPLMITSYYGHYSATEALIAAGAREDIVTSGAPPQSPESLARGAGNDLIADQLLTKSR